MSASLRLAPTRSPVRRALILGALALVIVEVTLVTWVALRQGLPPLVRWATVADVVLFTLGALWLAGGPRAAGLSAGKVVKSVAVGVVLFSLGLRVLGLPSSNLVLVLALAAEATVAVVLVVGLGRALRHPGETWERLRRELRTRLPTPVGEALFTEVRLMASAVAMVLRRPLRTPESSATVFAPMVESRSGWVLPVIAMATVMEGTAVHVLLYALMPDSGWVQAALLAVHAYGLLWLMGDRRLLWQSAYRLEAETLVLKLGMRFSASIAYGKVTRVLPLRTDAERRSVQPRQGRGNPKVTPLDEPNVHLCLSEPVTYTTFFGLTRQAQHLDLFVERPEAFIAALTERMGRQ
jgi:hypothetical protein